MSAIGDIRTAITRQDVGNPGLEWSYATAGSSPYRLTGWSATGYSSFCPDKADDNKLVPLGW